MADHAAFAAADSLALELGNELLGAIIVIAADGTILSWSEGATALFGFARDEIIGRSILDTIVPPELREQKRAWLASLPEDASETTETLRCRKDGVRIWIDTTARVHRSGDRRLIVLNKRDVTRARYRREAEVFRARFGGVLQAAPDAMVLVDQLGRIAHLNSETERLFGYARTDLLGELVERLIPERARDAHERHRAGYFDNPLTRPMGIGLQLAGRRKDGTEFPVEISLSPLTIDNTRLAMAAIRDVSARQLVEKALKSANEDLESFTYSVSHDLRAPIRQIHGFTRMLSEHLGDSLDATATHYLRRIEEGTQHMGRLVDDLLHLAHLGRQRVELRSVSLAEVVEEVLRSADAESSARQIEWRVERLPTVACDPGLIRIAFTNLIANALKYTRPRVHTVIEIGPVHRNGLAGAFVRDNGVGFDMKYAGKLFGVFQRLHSSDAFEGTGVGLATVQRIVHRHGGELWADAAIERGATFSFTIGRRANAPTGEGAS